MKKTNKKQAAAWVLSLLPLVMIAAVYRRLPAEVPMHWDLDGAVDYGAKAQLWVIAAMAPVLEAMFCFLPKIDPKNKNYDKFGDAYLGIQLVTLLFLAAMACAAAMGGYFPFGGTGAALSCFFLFLLTAAVRPTRREWGLGAIPAALFTFFRTVGYSYDTTDSYGLLLKNAKTLLSGALAMAAFLAVIVAEGKLLG